MTLLGSEVIRGYQRLKVKMIFESVKFWGGSVTKSDSAGVLHASFIPQSSSIHGLFMPVA